MFKINSNIYILLICHIIGDYYFQNNQLAQAKEKRINKLILHMLIYGLVFFICGLGIQLYYDEAPWINLLAAIIFHALIDWGKFYITKKIIIKEENIYLIDQLFHLITLIILGSILQEPIILGKQELILKAGLYVLLVFKPANVSFKKLFIKFKRSDIVESNNAGAIIGCLERLLMILLIFLDQFAAIGLVLTAKSIARYNKIAEDSNFAEYYLIGTLYSVLVTILFYVLLFKI